MAGSSSFQDRAFQKGGPSSGRAPGQPCALASAPLVLMRSRWEDGGRGGRKCRSCGGLAAVPNPELLVLHPGPGPASWSCVEAGGRAHRPPARPSGRGRPRPRRSSRAHFPPPSSAEATGGPAHPTRAHSRPGSTSPGRHKGTGSRKGSGTAACSSAYSAFPL